ncbi:phenazine biosynthesis-like domain-containing protein 1 isoform X2 [Stegodyphus dumicola]|uniref:phenazine biosynthesis-like domain-containing protein 1 isoform X2 n=1 Tax=Stegodyphus dumicola TaxID=202533 RepID=UPI0015B1BCB6|nr:phenazine biosynthesis-like domain-containing protein 1 isoform X2 [Stegodyphus dumicola]
MANNNKSEGIKLDFFIVEAFANQAFKGNSAAVCLIPRGQGISSSTKQQIASELNQPTTAFVSVINEKEAFQDAKQFALQWYSPTSESPLCGHGTLASAAVLFSIYDNCSETLNFETARGKLTAKWLFNEKVQLDLPAYEPKSPVMEEFQVLVKAVTGSYCVQEVLLSDSKYLMIRLQDNFTRKELELLNPKEAELLAATSAIRGVIVTVKGSGMNDCLDGDGISYDFISRVFAPWRGILEDPVCGAAHCVLGSYWAKILKKSKLYATECLQKKPYFIPDWGDSNIKLQWRKQLLL